MDLEHEPLGWAEADEVHIWQERCPAFETSWYQADLALLTPEERRRAACFKAEASEAQALFVRGRATLRRLIGRYLQDAPYRQAFTLGPYGKPNIGDTPLALEFNIAHSGACLIYAFSRQQPIGIDLEQVAPRAIDRNHLSLFFAPAEIEAILSCAASEYLTSFLRAWTAKEALIKASGDGFSADLLALSLNSDWLTLAAAPARYQAMKLSHLQTLEPGYIATLAKKGRLGTIRYCNFY